MTRKNILITGASAGLGLGMAKEFAKMGRNLALCARRMENLEALKRDLLILNPNIEVYIAQLDVDNHDQVFEVFNQFKQQMGQIDRIIVNAGIGKAAPIGTGYFYANKQTAYTNFVSALAQCEAAMTIFREQNAGHLVTISSISAVRGFKTGAVYGASKSALTRMSEAMAIEVLNTPIKVSCVHPGYIETDINKAVKNKPFPVDLPTGSRKLVAAIEKEGLVSFVPRWPWAVIRVALKVLPLRWLAKVT